ncbi:MAG: hypothetical protein KF752_03040 [Pirellulaceae bacterium]|nr:hypothetical protein [Pirellulaceae bacterium]
MPIPVTCPTCFTRFSVSDKFAGKSGPCPKCKATIKIPELAQQVVVHAPADKGPTDSKGKSVLKPIGRQDVKLSLPVILTAALGTLTVFAVAFGLRLSNQPPSAWIVGAAGLLLALPLVAVGYWFLRDDELQGFQGHELWVRCLICAVVFALGWALYRFIPAYLNGYESAAETSLLEMLLMFAVMIGLGTAAAVLTLEIELGQGLLLYALYLIVTLALAGLSGTPLGEVMPGKSSATDTRPRVRQPAVDVIEPKDDGAAEAAPASEPPPPTIPNLLQ